MDRPAVVIGAGIVGLATARAIRQARPSLPVIVVEKETAIACHQTGRNSGVIHAGVYYRPGSDKARLCTAGRISMVEYCREHGIPFEVCGKVVVAVSTDEIPRLEALRERCRANGVAVEMLGPAGLRDIEPHAAGLAALYVADTGIVSYSAVSDELAAELQANGVEIRTGVTVLGRRTSSDLTIDTDQGPLSAEVAVNCGGLQADRLARSMGAPGLDSMRIIPFRGEYYELVPQRSDLVRALIYPVPDPRFPFLGVHLTKGIEGHVHAGPNAVLALAREGYSWRAVSGRDLADTIRYQGFRRLARTHWRYGLHETVRSLSIRSFTRALQRLVPDVHRSDLRRAPAGVRAQAVRADGSLVDDFWFHRDGAVLHVLNAPSPAATASLEIGRIVAAELLGAPA
ncbi:MAG TPA: L-2-hydroxyglutarate oxidase [Acidimicrobiales bacterium]|nr:L-2-hydroxyglutarate oxidase [Acidimicrobiales bacterium]